MDGMTVGQPRAFLADIPVDTPVVACRKGGNIISDNVPIGDMVYMFTKAADKESETVVLLYDLG